MYKERKNVTLSKKRHLIYFRIFKYGEYNGFENQNLCTYSVYNL